MSVIEGLNFKQKWAFFSTGRIQSLWNGAETGLTFWDGFIGNIRLSAGYTACASLPEDVDVIQSQSAGNVYGSMGGYWAPISMGS